jgi:Protein of unknown function (DUF3386)
MNPLARPSRWVAVILATVVLTTLATQARAHFLFIRIEPQAEAGRSAEVFFSEQAEAGDPKFVAKIAHTKLWVQTRPGEFHELPLRQAADRLRAALPVDRSLSIVGECEYGVLARPKQTPFLLRYYPKAVAGNPDELNRLTPRREVPFEIQPAFETRGQANDKSAEGRIRLVALRNGKPIPSAIFTAVDSELSEQTIKAGPDGTALWAPAAPGRYSIYTRETLKQPGTLGDKKYDEVREFATLALNWPVERHDGDPEAGALFKEAIALRAEWRDFPGFSAELTGSLDGRPFTGKVTVQRNGSVDLETDDPAAKTWLQDQLDSLVMHRLAQPASEPADTHQPRLHFADLADDHPLGRLLAVEGDAMGSSYRIKDRQITVVNRRMGKQNMTITVLESDKNPEGRFLPHSYVVNYWDTATGKLNRVETFQERSQRVGSWDLPRMRSILTASESGLSIKVVTFSKHALLGSK